MGIIAKSLTKKRVAPASGPLNGSLTGAPWTTTGAVPTGALVLSAAFSVKIDGLKSTVGSQIGTFIPTQQAHLYVESTDFKSWRLFVGLPNNQKLIVVDWMVDLVLDTTARTASVVTSQFRTVDDALMHADQHDTLRTDLLRAMSLGAQTDADAEEKISALSLRTEQSFGKRPPDPFVLEFDFSTSLGESVLRERLSHLGHRVRETTAASIRWGLGLPSDQGANDVTIALGDQTMRGVARVAGESATARRVAAADLRSFIARTMFLLKRADAEAAFHGPQEWKP